MSEISDKQLDRVISLLEGDNPITKKKACELLGIKYNTKRLDKLVEERKETKERISRNKKKKMGTELSDSEISYIISSYIEGDSLESISNSVYRSIPLLKKVLEDLCIPPRMKKEESKNITIPDNAVLKEASPGEIVFSIRYNQYADILEYYGEYPTGKAYKIWLRNSQMFAYECSHRLWKISEVLNKYNVTLLGI